MERFFTTASLVLIALAAEAQVADSKPRAVTHEDVWLMKRLGKPVVSPDGRYAIVEVTEPSYEKDGTVSDLWLLAVDGDSAPRRITTTPEAEAGVDWSPDGSKIAFSTKRGEDKESQIYVLDMQGPGEAERVTNLSTGAVAPKWSPDGRRIAFESRVFPGTADDADNIAEKKARDEREYNVSVYEMFPIRQWDRWRDDLQTHLFVQDATAGSMPVDLLAGSELIESPGFNGFPILSKDSLLAVWTPDGEALLISASTNLDQAAHRETTYHLYKVPASGGPISQLTESEDWSCHTAHFSADGKALYCLIEPVSDYAYSLTKIGRFDWRDGTTCGEPTIITSNFDRSVEDMDVSADGRTVYLTAFDAGRSRLYSVPSKGGTAKLLNEEERGVYAGVQSAGRQLVAKWESSAIPAEVVRINPANGQRASLSEFNVERAAQIDRKAFLEFWFENQDGNQVHSWLALPPAFDETRKYPLVMMIHGGPFTGTLDTDQVRWSPHLLAAPGYVALMTDYTGSVGYGEAFSRSIQGSPLRRPSADLLDAADEAIRRYPFIDPERQAAVGASYGGHLVNWLQATTTRFNTLVSHAGLIDLEGQYTSSDKIYNRETMIGSPAWSSNPVWRNESPASYANDFSTPMLLTIGEKDFRVPINQTIGTWSYLQRMQVPGRLLVFHDANHWIMKGSEARFYWAEVHTWLASYLLENTDSTFQDGSD